MAPTSHAQSGTAAAPSVLTRPRVKLCYPTLYLLSPAPSLPTHPQPTLASRSSLAPHPLGHTWPGPRTPLSAKLPLPANCWRKGGVPGPPQHAFVRHTASLSPGVLAAFRLTQLISWLPWFSPGILHSHSPGVFGSHIWP